MILRQVVDFLRVPDDVPAGVAKRMERQQVLYDGDHHFDVILGEQALYTNIGGPEVMREQMERLLQDIDLPSLSLGVLAAIAEVSVIPMPGFNMYDDVRVHYELVSTGVDVTEPDELALHDKAFNALSSVACLRRRRQGPDHQGPGVLEQRLTDLWPRRRSRPVASRWHQGTQGRPVLPSVAVPGCSWPGGPKGGGGGSGGGVSSRCRVPEVCGSGNAYGLPRTPGWFGGFPMVGLQPLCRRHHRLKTHHPGWRVTRDPHTGIASWTSPTGIRTGMRRPFIGSE
ncbi:Scr1 family TA system antitoxin-like transcriptional regulator [Streptomyces mirabilis]|uniref:Scr1 family TA system antitoxin-like transcriptional regulator n=1 Tax=Streptomyces mirabilis TaxID=68239 RepID=UPI0036DF8B00